jgi:mRNA interferase YafQ
MRTLIWSNCFVRASRRIIKKNSFHKKSIQRVLSALTEDPFLPQLETHKLKGKLSGSWGCSVDYDLRIVFDFVANENQGDDDIFLIDIGTHDEVY